MLPGALSTKSPSVCITAMVPSCPAVWVSPSGMLPGARITRLPSLCIWRTNLPSGDAIWVPCDPLAWVQLTRRIPAEFTGGNDSGRAASTACVIVWFMPELAAIATAASIRLPAVMAASMRDFLSCMAGFPPGLNKSRELGISPVVGVGL